MKKTLRFILCLLLPPLSLAQAQITYPISLQTIADGAVLGCGGGLDCIPSIQYPEMQDPDTDVLRFLQDEDLVIGIEIEDETRAYPLRSLWFHEIVNDRINNTYFAICYCPLTRTAIAVSTKQGEAVVELGVSGFLFNNNLIMYDRSNWPNSSFYPQMYFTGINGPDFDIQLDLLPVTMMTWKIWRTLNPNTLVIDERWYETAFYPYGGYRTNHNDFVFPQEVDPRRLSKEIVFGYTSKNFKAKAYPFADFRAREAINDEFDGESLLFVLQQDGHFSAAFDRTSIEGFDTLDFDLIEDGDMFTFMKDRETESIWRIDGKAVSGPLAGQRLRQVERAYTGYWFAWGAYFAPVTLYDGRVSTGNEEDFVPVRFELLQNYPNPFNPSTVVTYDLPELADVKVEVFTVLGELVEILVEERQGQGRYQVEWDASGQAGGTYILRITAGAFQKSRKMLLVR